MKLIKKQFILNVLSGPTSSGLGILATLIGYPLYLNYLGFELYGNWLVLSTVLALAQLGNLGIQPTIIKLVAESGNKKEEIEKLSTNSILMLLLSGFCILLVILLLRDPLIDLFNLSVDNKIVVISLLPHVGLLSIFVIVNQAINALLAGLGRYDLANYLMSLNRIIIVSVATIFLFLGFGVKSLLIANFIGYTIIFLASIIILYYKFSGLRLFIFSYLSKKTARNIIEFGTPIMGSSFMNLFLTPFNKLIISRYIGVEYLPIYEISYNGTMQFRNLFESGIKSILPEISRERSNSLNSIKKYINTTARTLLFISVPIYSLLIIFSEPVLNVWLGQNTSNLFIEAFRIMLVGTFFSLMGVISYYYLIGLGYTKKIFVANIIQVTGNLLILIPLISFYNDRLNILYVILSISTAMLLTTIYLLVQHLKVEKSSS